MDMLKTYNKMKQNFNRFTNKTELIFVYENELLLRQLVDPNDTTEMDQRILNSLNDVYSGICYKNMYINHIDSIL